MTKRREFNLAHGHRKIILSLMYFFSSQITVEKEMARLNLSALLICVLTQRGLGVSQGTETQVTATTLTELQGSNFAGWAYSGTTCEKI
jgi:hypothetical protein